MSPTASLQATRPLEDLATIRNGFVPRQLVEDPFGAYRGLQVRDLGADGDVSWSRLTSPRVTGDAERYELRAGDLVVTLRGAPRAWHITSPPRRVIVVGQLAIVTPLAETVDSGYLTWFLNHPATVATLRARAQGTSLPFVSMGELRQLRVPMPALHVQRAIGRVATLARDEQRLQRQLADARRRLTDVQLLRVARPR